MRKESIRFPRFEIKTILLFGILAAIAGNFYFRIPGMPGASSDPREIVALTSIFFLKDWRSVLGVALLATLGGPYDNSLPITLVMHVVTLPLGWFIYQTILLYTVNEYTLALVWAAEVILLYVTSFIPLYIIMAVLMDKVHLSEVFRQYIIFFEGVRIEIISTTVITTLILLLKLSREEMIRDTQLLSLLVKNNNLGIWEWNVGDGRFLLNKEWLDLLPYTVEQDVNNISVFKTIVHPDDLESVESILNELSTGSVPMLKSEFRLKDKNNQWKWVLISGKVLEEDKAKQVTRVIGTFQDITSIKEAEKENQKLQNQLRQAQKMESIGTLAGGIAHDFNNLLTVINGHAEMGALKAGEFPGADKHFLAIQSAGRRAANLTNQLLAFSRKQIYKPRVVNINTVISNFDQMLGRLIGEDINIETYLKEELPNILADPGQLEQILFNLIINARDAINEKTDDAEEKKITIETDFVNFTDTYLSDHSYARAGRYIVLSISDTGQGMDEATRQKIFEPFFTTKSEGKGTGLGLSTVYGIIKQNNGYISVYSEPGSGSTFKIYWPATDRKRSSGAKPAVDIRKFFGSEEILLVEDDPAVRDFAASALNDFGYRVHIAENGQNALDLLQRENLNPSLVITDLIMPKMNGKDLADRLKLIKPKCRVLFASGYTDNHVVHNGSLQAGVNFLHKPYSVSDLLRKVRTLLDQPEDDLSARE